MDRKDSAARGGMPRDCGQTLTEDLSKGMHNSVAKVVADLQFKVNHTTMIPSLVLLPALHSLPIKHHIPSIQQSPKQPPLTSIHHTAANAIPEPPVE